MKIGRIISIILVIIWMGVIYSFSNQNGDDSQNLSDKVTIKVLDARSKIVKKEYTKKEKKIIADKYSFIVRKIAHFTIYLILGILVLNMLKQFNLKKEVLMSIIICTLYAFTDEMHQFFIAERAFRVLDICIDSFGSMTGILVGGWFYEKNSKLKKCKYHN